MCIRDSSKAAAASHGAANGTLPLFGLHDDLDPRADGGAVGFHALELEFQPVVPVARIGEKLVVVVVAFDRAANDGIDVLVAVIVDVSKGDPMALLQLAEAA